MEEFGSLWYWTLKKLIACAPLMWLLAVALVAYNWAGPDVPNGTINLVTGMAITGTLSGLFSEHLWEDRRMRRELMQAVERATRAPGSSSHLRLLRGNSDSQYPE